jgi:pyruvate/2-oxoglutarate dehydrogenase complex dihydrolipoamide acyltransferase (E2) component
MMAIFGCKPCQPSDPTTDTVKVNSPVMEAQVREEVQEAQQRAAAEEEARRQAEEAAQKQARLLALEEEARRRAEFERQQEQKRRELALAEEEARRRQEAAERLRQAEEQKLAEERQRRKEVVDAFLKANKFKGVNAPKKSMLGTTYPLHRAVEKVDVQMVEDLIQEGADTQQKNSYGRTPAQLAQKKDKKGSHTAILQKLEA